MANNYTGVSFSFKANSDEERDFLKRCFQDIDEIDEATTAMLTEEGIIDENSTGTGATIEISGDEVSIYNSEDPDLERIAASIGAWQVKFNIEEPLIMEYARWCSRPVTDQFGGGACVIYKGNQHWKDSYYWAMEKIKELQGA